MNWLYLILLGVLTLIILGKWIIFVLMCPLLIKYNKFRYKQALKTAQKDKLYKELQEGEIKICPQRIGILSKIKSVFSRYLQGYTRYMQFQVAFIPSHRIRNFLYREVYLVKMEKNSIIYFGTEIRGGYMLAIGEGSIIGDNAILDARRGGINIGKNVQLGSGVRLWTGSHDHDDPLFRSTSQKRGPIKIGDRAWLGPGVTVLHSVSIGEGAVVAAGAVVTKDVEPYVIMGGIPAKKIGVRTQNLVYNFSGNYVPFY